MRVLSVEALKEIHDQARRLMRAHPLSSGDALQLAAACMRFDPPMKRDFVVVDGQLARAADREGFNVIRLVPPAPRQKRR